MSNINAGSPNSPSFHPRRIAPDANHIIVWRMDGTSGNILNTGSGGACDLIPYGSPGPVRNAPGLFGACSIVGVNRGEFATARPAPINIPDSFTMEAWIKSSIMTGDGSIQLFQKKYDAGATWLFPYVVASLSWAYGFGGWLITTGPTMNQLGLGYSGAAAGYPRTQLFNTWTHVAHTWDNSTHLARLWINGARFDERTAVGALAKGTNGEWVLSGQRPVDNWWDESGSIYYEDVRVSNIARDATYFENIVKNGLPSLTQVA